MSMPGLYCVLETCNRIISNYYFICNEVRIILMPITGCEATDSSYIQVDHHVKILKIYLDCLQILHIYGYMKHLLSLIKTMSKG